MAVAVIGGIVGGIVVISSNAEGPYPRQMTYPNSKHTCGRCLALTSLSFRNSVYVHVHISSSVSSGSSCYSSDTYLISCSSIVTFDASTSSSPCLLGRPSPRCRGICLKLQWLVVSNPRPTSSSVLFHHSGGRAPVPVVFVSGNSF